MTSDEQEKGFMGRWSARKQATRQEREARASDSEVQGAQEPVPPAEDEAAKRELEEHIANLPDPESLNYDSDFTPFFREGVPEFLKRRALRVLWRSNPVLANLDGLIDYGEDFTDKAMVVPNLKTLYRVGKGMFSDEDLEIEERRLAGETAPAEELKEGESQQAEAEEGESPDSDALSQASPENPGEGPESCAPIQDQGAEEAAELPPTIPNPIDADPMRTQESAEASEARGRSPLPVAKKRPVLARRWGQAREED